MLELNALTTESLKVATGLAKVAIGRSDVTPEPRDKRFADPAFTENPLYRRWAQAYLVCADAIERIAVAGPRRRGDWRREVRARAAATKLIDAAAPTNLLLGNPAALKRAFDTGGASLVRGWANALRDVSTNGGMPAQVDRRPFKVGENLAATPGAVIHREELFELLEYRPSTPRVRSRPLLMIPPQVNKHYFLDLAPGRSLTEYLVSRGVHYFTVVWRNPRHGDGHWGLDDYVAAQLRALDIVREVSGSDQAGVLGACAGGLTTALMLGHLAAAGRADAVSSATLAISMLDSSHENPIAAIATDAALSSLARDAERGTVYESAQIARAFAWMRPNELVFNYAVNNWLLGQQPTAFDILAWNNDGANLPARFYCEMLDLYGHNRAATPGARARAGHADRPQAGRLRQLRRVRDDGPHHAVDARLHDQPAPGRQHGGRRDLHRSHPDHGQPARQGAGPLLRRAGGRPGPGSVDGRGDRARGVLVAALCRLAARTLRRRAGCPGAVWAAAATRRSSPPPGATCSTECRRAPEQGGVHGAQVLRDPRAEAHLRRSRRARDASRGRSRSAPGRRARGAGRSAR